MSEPTRVEIDGNVWERREPYGWVYVNEDDPTMWQEQLMLDRIAGLEDEVRLLRNRIRYTITPDGDKWRVRDTVVPQSMTFNTRSEAIALVESLTPAVDYPYPDAKEATP